MQRDAVSVHERRGARAGAARAIAEIADHGQSGGGELDADLMFVPGARTNGQQRAARGGGVDAIGQFRALGARRVEPDDAAGRPIDPGKETIDQRDESLVVGGGGRAAFDDGVVFFFNRACTEGVGQSGGGLSRTGEKEDAGDGAVESVGGGEEDMAGFGVFFFEVGAGEVKEAGVAGGVGLNADAGGFVDGQQMVVFIENGRHRMEGHGGGRFPCGG